MLKTLIICSFTFIFLSCATQNPALPAASGAPQQQITKARFYAPEAIYNNASNLLFLYTKDKDKKTNGSGTAFVIDKSGILITAYHMVNDKAIKEVFALIPAGNGKWKEERVNWILPLPQYDLALLRVNRTFPTQVKLRDEKILSGEPVYALGYPLTTEEDLKTAKNAITASQGFIFKYQYINVSDALGVKGIFILAFLPIAFGNSGCPAFDKDGNVIGLINAQMQIPPAKGYAFSVIIPATHIETLLQMRQALIKHYP
jgi:S1-C subfamily serine protease